MNAAQERWLAQQPAGSASALKSKDEAERELPDEMERVIRRRVWWRKPSCWRREEHATGSMIKILCEGHFWFYMAAGGKLYTNVLPGDKQLDLQIKERKPRKGEVFPELESEIREVPVVDPSFLLATHNLEPIEDTEFLGREAVRVRGVFRQGREPSWEPRFWGFADEHEFPVDRERGILLRYVARFQEQDFAVASVEEVIFDETLPEDIFSFSPPPDTEVDVVS